MPLSPALVPLVAPFEDGAAAAGRPDVKGARFTFADPDRDVALDLPPPETWRPKRVPAAHGIEQRLHVSGARQVHVGSRAASKLHNAARTCKDKHLTVPSLAPADLVRPNVASPASIEVRRQ